MFIEHHLVLHLRFRLINSAPSQPYKVRLTLYGLLAATCLAWFFLPSSHLSFKRNDSFGLSGGKPGVFSLAL